MLGGLTAPLFIGRVLFMRLVLYGNHGVVMLSVQLTEYVRIDEVVMTALEVILKSRRDSVAKLDAQIAGIESQIRDCSLTVKPVFEMELKVKTARRARLVKEVDALQAEVDRLAGPSLPGMARPSGKR